MFIKYELKLEIFVAVSWNYGKWFISLVWSAIPLIEQSVVKVWIIALLYISTSSFVENLLVLKS